MKVSVVLFAAGLTAILDASLTFAQDVASDAAPAGAASGQRGGGGHHQRVPGKVAAAWYAGWHAGQADFPLSKVPWSKYTILTYAFA